MGVIIILEINNRVSTYDNNPKENCIGKLDSVFECVESSGLSAVVIYLKSVRLNKLSNLLYAIDVRKVNALNELEGLRNAVDEVIATNRGGKCGIHGFIGERAQVFLKNAWQYIKGNPKVSELIDDNGMTDYYEYGVLIQQKACKNNGLLGLDHIMRHKDKYPQFNGKYQIPKDFYEKYESIGNLSMKEAGHLHRHEWKLWHEIQMVKQLGVKVEPMLVTYDEIQADRIYDTIANHEENIVTEANAQFESASELYKPTAAALLKTTTMSSVIEGLLAGTTSIIEKRFSGRRLTEFEATDYKEVALIAANGMFIGAVRGASIYCITNYTKIPGEFAGATVTIFSDSVKSIKMYKEGTLTERDCKKRIAKAAIVATAGSIGAKLGGKLCSIPVVGEVVGGFLFSYLADRGYGIIIKATEFGFQNRTTIQSA